MQGGFSIREYASRMRIINVVNCWPFDETISEETVKSLLPPITVKKFSWWLDELQYMNPESAKNVEKKKKKVLENGDQVERVKMKSAKGKIKAPKKRSIVEIFAEAPQVERVISEEEVDEDFDSNTKRNNKKMMKKNRDLILKKALRVAKQIKKKKKENCFKLKLQARDEDTGNPSSSYSKELENGINVKRKPRLQHLDGYRKTVPRKALKLIEENQHPKLPVRGILKNRGKAFSLKQSRKCILREAVQVNHSSAEKVNKHVTFSEKNEILRLSRKPSQSIECLQKICGSGMGYVDHAGGVGKDSAIIETSGSKNASLGIGKEVGTRPASDFLTRTHLDSTTFMNQNDEEEHWSRSDQDCSESGLRDAPHNSMDACQPPRIFRVPLDGYYYNPNINVIRNSSTRLNAEFVTPGPIFHPLCFKDHPRMYNESSVSHLSNTENGTNKLPQASSESTAVNNARSFQSQSFPNLYPKELPHTFCSLLDERSINGINEQFIGLPLNSQGELVTFNSNAKRDVNQTMNSSGSAAHSISSNNAVGKFLGHHSECRRLDYRTSSMDQLNLFPVESYVKENTTAVIPSRLGITESQSDNKTNLELDFLEKVNYHSFHDFGENQVQKSPGNEKVQSTMRLMGKEFKVSGRGVQGFEDGHIWKDKQIIDELHMDQNERSLGKLRETLFCPSEFTIDHRSESGYILPHFDCQAGSVSQNAFVPRKVNPVYNSESLSSEPFRSVYNSRLFTVELPAPTAAHQELCPNISPSASHLKNEQNLHYSPISAVRFPFMHPDLDGHSKSSWSRRSSVNQPPFCFDVSKTQLSNSQSCSVGHNHPYGTDSTALLQPEHFRVYRPFSSASSLQMSVAPSFLPPSRLTHHGFAPYYPAVLPVSAMQKRHGVQKKFKERIGIRRLDIGKKSKGHLSALSNVPFKPVKMPTLGSKEGFQGASGKPTSYVSFQDSVKNMEDAFESCSITNKSKFVMCDEYEANKDERIISPWADSHIDNARTGPVKLAAGVKHILKACQPKDQSSSRPTDQDLSLFASTTGFRFSESENQAKFCNFSRKAPVFEL